MTEYDNKDTGALFKNDKKGNDKAPDYTGDIYMQDNKKRRIAAWLKTSAGGKNYMSLKVSDLLPPRTEAPKDYAVHENVTGGVAPDPEFDDIPF